MSECDLGGRSGCPEMGNADVAEGEGRWRVPDSATCFLSSISALGIEGSSSMSSPEKEKLNADILNLELALVMTDDAREVNFQGYLRRKGKVKREPFSRTPRTLKLQ